MANIWIWLTKFQPTICRFSISSLAHQPFSPTSTSFKPSILSGSVQMVHLLKVWAEIVVQCAKIEVCVHLLREPLHRSKALAFLNTICECSTELKIVRLMIGAAWHIKRRRRLLDPMLVETGSLYVFFLYIYTLFQKS
ncbi:hypothetical protein Hdeb2414_s0018g00519961 [Helianthus debilis subsp. tardiflorus]